MYFTTKEENVIAFTLKMASSTTVGIIYLGEETSTTIEVNLPDLPGSSYFWKVVFTTDNNQYDPNIPSFTEEINVGECVSITTPK